VRLLLAVDLLLGSLVVALLHVGVGDDPDHRGLLLEQVEFGRQELVVLGDLLQLALEGHLLLLRLSALDYALQELLA